MTKIRPVVADKRVLESLDESEIIVCFGML